jgi:hypothetical protein
MIHAFLVTIGVMAVAAVFPIIRGDFDTPLAKIQKKMCINFLLEI